MWQNTTSTSPKFPCVYLDSLPRLRGYCTHCALAIALIFVNLHLVLKTSIKSEKYFEKKMKIFQSIFHVLLAKIPKRFFKCFFFIIFNFFSNLQTMNFNIFILNMTMWRSYLFCHHYFWKKNPLTFYLRIRNVLYFICVL